MCIRRPTAFALAPVDAHDVLNYAHIHLAHTSVQGQISLEANRSANLKSNVELCLSFSHN